MYLSLVSLSTRVLSGYCLANYSENGYNEDMHLERILLEETYGVARYFAVHIQASTSILLKMVENRKNLYDAF
jgi:hypothetical protein